MNELIFPQTYAELRAWALSQHPSRVIGRCGQSDHCVLATFYGDKNPGYRFSVIPYNDESLSFGGFEGGYVYHRPDEEGESFWPQRRHRLPRVYDDLAVYFDRFGGVGHHIMVSRFNGIMRRFEEQYQGTLS